jgi:hypothetical protein
MYFITSASKPSPPIGMVLIPLRISAALPSILDEVSCFYRFIQSKSGYGHHPLPNPYQPNLLSILFKLHNLCHWKSSSNTQRSQYMPPTQTPSPQFPHFYQTSVQSTVYMCWVCKRSRNVADTLQQTRPDQTRPAALVRQNCNKARFKRRSTSSRQYQCTATFANMDCLSSNFQSLCFGIERCIMIRIRTEPFTETCLSFSNTFGMFLHCLHITVDRNLLCCWDILVVGYCI